MFSGVALGAVFVCEQQFTDAVVRFEFHCSKQLGNSVSFQYRTNLSDGRVRKLERVERR